jgi:hypothetical protein
MAIIAQYDTDPVLVNIKNRHHAWHTFPGGAHGFPSRAHNIGTVGSGREFFQFHRDLMNEFFAWNNVHQAATPAQLAAWHSVPPEMKIPVTGWPVPWPGLDLAAAEQRINTNSPAFINDDAFGIHVETTIHNWIHGAVAATPAFNLPPAEQDIIKELHSVQSTWFYKIHGLVDHWWTRFLHPKNVFKEIIDTNPKLVFKETVDAHPPHKHIIDVPLKPVIDVPPKGFKEQVEGPGKNFGDVPDPFKPGIDPAVVQELVERVKQLEARVPVKISPFIRPFQRPVVGENIVKKENKPRK